MKLIVLQVNCNFHFVKHSHHESLLKNESKSVSLPRNDGKSTSTYFSFLDKDMSAYSQQLTSILSIYNDIDIAFGH